MAGAGIGCAPLWLAAAGLRAGTVVELLPAWRDAPVEIAMVRRDGRLTPRRVSLLLAFLKANAPDPADLS